MKVIFLDVDGVLNTRPGSLDADKIDLLRGLVDATGAKVVLSTSWREVPRMKERLVKALRKWDIEVEGSTPDISYKTVAWGWETKAPRRDEIGSWLRGNPQVAAFVILDDDTNASIEGSFVWINPWEGLTDLDCKRAIKILNDTSQ